LEKPVKKYVYKGGDASFLGVGVPYVHVYTTYTEEELRTKLSWATLSPWIHSEEDSIDKVDKELFEMHLKFYAILILRLCNVEILPYNVAAIVNKLIEDLRTINMLSDERLLFDVLQLAEKLKEYSLELEKCKKELERRVKNEKLKGYSEVVELVNKSLIKVNRSLSHILKTVAGKYEQDPYDYTFVKKPIPRLYIPIKKLNELQKGSHEYLLWYTKLLREKNVVIDHIQNTIDYLKITLTRIKEIINLQ